MPLNVLAAQPYLGKPLFAVRSALDTSVEPKMRGKEPLVSQWQHAPKCVSLDRFKSSEAGYAVEPGFLIIDVDVRDGKQGLQSLRKLNEDFSFNFIDGTPVKVLTGSGGLHLYYKKPESISLRKKHDGYPDIDFLSNGHYAVIAGSAHACGKEYQWIERVPHTIDEAADVPESLLAALERKELELVGSVTELTDELIQYAAEVAQFLPEAVQGANGDDTTFKNICKLKDIGLDQQTALDILLEFWNPRCSPPWDEEELKQKIVNAYSYGRNGVGSAQVGAVMSSIEEINAEYDNPSMLHDPNDIGAHNWISALEYKTSWRGKELIKNVMNCRIILKYAPAFAGGWAYDAFKESAVLTRSRPWHPEPVPPGGSMVNQRMLHDIRRRFMDFYKEDFSLPVIDETVAMVCYENTFHPVQAYLNRLTWDGVDRLSDFLPKYCKTNDGAYERAVGVRWFVGAVSRVLVPGSQVDQMLILEGSQGLGKSNMARILAGDWYLGGLGSLSSGNESEELLRGKWIVEIAELNSFKKAEMSRIKDFVTKTNDTYREKYARRATDFRRQCVFIGTTNESHFLRDEENRRFWPVTCRGSFDNDALLRDRDQLWAQATHLFNKGHPSFLETRELQDLARSHAQKYAIVDPWKYSVAEYVNGMNPTGRSIDETDVLSVYCEGLRGSARSAQPYDMARICIILKTLGWVEGPQINSKRTIWYRNTPGGGA